ncbi:glycosyltransferase [Geobacillus subterraneus]|uniref:glycosyltransferase n=1 Tax=Geobacillus subterraneus TaxID=129338 RepID=UPI00162076D2
MEKKISFFIPSLRGGGAERVILNLAKTFSYYKYDVDLVTVKAEGAYLSQVPKKINIIDLNAPRVSLSLIPLIKYLNKNKPYALISAMNHVNIIAILATKLALVKTKVLISEHSTLSRSLMHPENFRSRLLPFFMKFFYPFADKIIAVSHGVADDLAKALNFPRSKIEVIYNPVVSDELFEKANQEVDHPWFKDSQCPVILAVGRLTEAKDFPTLIRAFHYVRQKRKAKLVILGEGEKRAELINLVKKLGLDNDVDIAGFVENPYSYMKGCSVFVLSSKWEGLPTVLVEALACGANIVATDCPSGPREILKNGEYGSLVNVGDEKALAREIFKKLEDGQNKKILKEVYKPFTNETVFKNYLKLLI